MYPAPFVLVTLMFSSLMLSVILWMAWRAFDHPRHALIWACAYFCVGVQSLFCLAWTVWLPNNDLELFFLKLPIIVCMALLALGFRQRAGLPHRVGVVALIIASTFAGLAAVSFAWPHRGLQSGIVPLYAAMVLPVGAHALLAGRRPLNTAERAAVVMILLFAAYEAVMVAMALMQGQAGDPSWLLRYRAGQFLGLPSAFIGVGLASIFLLAADQADQARKLAMIDPLTGILNRRGLEQAAVRAIANCRRAGQPLSVVIADLDRFKAINDSHGHAAGDYALQRFSEFIGRAVRKGDLIGRMGGEEFGFVLVNTGDADARDVIERIRIGVAELDMGLGRPRLTASFGVAGLQADDEDFCAVLIRADHALYQSKLDGRNRVTVAGAGEQAARPHVLA